MKTKCFVFAMVICLLASLLGSGSPVDTVPVTSVNTAPVRAEKLKGLPPLESFIQSVVNGKSNQVVGVYIPGTWAMPVVQQPGNDVNFVSREPEVLTQFNAASRFHTIGLLAHNYLAGAQYLQMRMNQIVIVIYGNGRLSYYRIKWLEQYQALTPNSPQSDFVDLSNSKAGKMTAGDLFNRVYTQGNRVVFQTCISAEGEPSWGRMFIIASPLEEDPYASTS